MGTFPQWVAAITSVAGLVAVGGATYVVIQARVAATEKIQPVVDKMIAMDLRLTKTETRWEDVSRRLDSIEAKLDRVLS